MFSYHLFVRNICLISRKSKPAQSTISDNGLKPLENHIYATRQIRVYNDETKFFSEECVVFSKL